LTWEEAEISFLLVVATDSGFFFRVVSPFLPREETRTLEGILDREPDETEFKLYHSGDHWQIY
jgi:hypothetical protein